MLGDGAGLATPHNGAVIPRFSRLLIVLLGALAALMLSLPAAHAHSELLSSSPEADAQLETVPTEVVLTFSEPLQAQLSVVRVVDGEGLPMTRGEPTVAGDTLTQELLELHPGGYTITYKVISADGHPISDAISFTISSSAASASPSAPAPSSPSQTTSTQSESSGTSTPSAATATASPASAAADTETDDDAGGFRWLVLVAAVVAGAAIAWFARRRVAGRGTR